MRIRACVRRRSRVRSGDDVRVTRDRSIGVVFFPGKYCETAINWCDGNLNPCKNNGRCSKTNQGYK